MTGPFNPFTPFTQQCKTVRELRLEALLVRCLPIVIKAEMSPSTCQEYRALIADIETELPTEKETND